MLRFKNIFPHKLPAVIGMVHVQALPGTPLNKHPVEKLVEAACAEAETYSKCNVDAVLVENMHDLPYCTGSQLGPEVTACMTRVASEVRRVIPASRPVGVQVLAAGNHQALAVAAAAGLQFIRAECFVYSHVADEGWLDASAGPLLRYRRHIGADDVSVWCDVKKKHSSHAVTADLSVGEVARGAQFFLSDGVIVTGGSTGEPANPAHIAEVQSSCDLPVLVGSGVTADNVASFAAAHGLIVGSEFKEGGRWDAELSEERIRRFMDAVSAVRER
ncbi:uncharacterized protein F13E9.13, mitochondrial-like [Amphibalanus amphitrite]|uniref:uncharacterized protein F13E9.13, mitochondrial-like n=1 Tax=Amphibalanus amphitrite TaxID=1232801 RepID=UPI001C90E9AB|nr:uncharacterized protein F13E9.13, mitochondrial-like [Amphibalanus amphitrite]